jgi:hypothetical protein
MGLGSWHRPKPLLEVASPPRTTCLTLAPGSPWRRPLALGPAGKDAGQDKGGGTTTPL